jgi:hypothetical protein
MRKRPLTPTLPVEGHGILRTASRPSAIEPTIFGCLSVFFFAVLVLILILLVVILLGLFVHSLQ